MAAINCLCAHTVSHPQLTDKDCHIPDPVLEAAVVNMMSCILPGVMAALQDVATCTNNPGHAIVVVTYLFNYTYILIGDKFWDKVTKFRTNVIFLNTFANKMLRY